MGEGWQRESKDKVAHCFIPSRPSLCGKCLALIVYSDGGFAAPENFDDVDQSYILCGAPRCA